MSLAVRIIPCLDVNKGRVVKGTKFLELKDAGDPVSVAKRYNQESADELIFLDITASLEDRAITLKVVQKTAEQVFIPLTVGGGIRTIQDVKLLLRSGADKVSINTAAALNPKLIKEASSKFGAQCIVVAIDAKKENGKWRVYIHGGRTPTKLDAVDWAEKAQEYGAGEILLTSMDRDGTQNGYDLDLLKILSKKLSIPIIASGGAGKKEDFYTAWKSGASACLAASLFHYQKLTILEVKKFLNNKKVPVRL